MYRFVVTIAYFLRICINSQGVVEQAEDGMSGTIKFGPPDMSDEMANSPFVPDDLKCDACRTVAYQLWTGFSAYNSKRPSLNYNIPESDLIDLTDVICSDDKTWEGYGVKEVKKVTRLSGPGLETADIPGITASGGKWPRRLRDLCETFMGDVGEQTVYKVYHKNTNKLNNLEDFLCRGDKIRGNCRGVKRKQDSKTEL